MRRGTRWTGILIAGWLTGCGGPRVATPMGDTVFHNHLSAGAMAYASRDLAGAEQQFQAALTRAELADDRAGIGEAARNLAVVKLERGHWEAARALLAEASAHPTLPSAAAEIRLLSARVEAGIGAVPAAREILEELLADPGASSGPIHSRTLLLSAELALRSGDVEGARTTAERLGAEPFAHLAPSLQARRHGLLAVLAETDQAWPIAADARMREAVAWRAGHDWRSMARALERAGDVRLQQGQVDQALDLWLRSAGSLSAQGEGSRARDVLRRCREYAVNNPRILSRVDRLLATVEEPP